MKVQTEIKSLHHHDTSAMGNNKVRDSHYISTEQYGIQFLERQERQVDSPKSNSESLFGCALYKRQRMWEANYLDRLFVGENINTPRV